MNHHLRELKFFSSCEVSLRLSLEFFEALHKAMDQDPKGEKDQQVLQAALFQSGVIAYCRPFKQSKVAEKIERCITQRDAQAFEGDSLPNKAIHQQLLQLRDQLVAHHDLRHLDASVILRDFIVKYPDDVGLQMPPTVIGTDVIVEVHGVQRPKASKHLLAILRHVRAVTFSIQGLRIIQETLMLEARKANPSEIVTPDSMFEVLPPIELIPNGPPVDPPSPLKDHAQIAIHAPHTLDIRGINLISLTLFTHWNNRRSMNRTEIESPREFPDATTSS